MVGTTREEVEEADVRFIFPPVSAPFCPRSFVAFPAFCAPENLERKATGYSRQVFHYQSVACLARIVCWWHLYNTLIRCLLAEFVVSVQARCWLRNSRSTFSVLEIFRVWTKDAVASLLRVMLSGVIF